jgi:hypothetical protein
MIALFNGQPMVRIQFDANILVSRKGYGLWSGRTSQGQKAISTHVQEWKFTRNLVVGPPANAHPIGNWYERDMSSVGFSKPDDKGIGLAKGSRFRGYVAGRDPGVDLAQLQRRLAGVEQPSR